MALPMKLSRKSDYALRALITLVDEFGNGPIPSVKLPSGTTSHRVFLRKFMLEPKRLGAVESIPGRVGGFLIGKQPHEITMRQLVRHFDGVLAPISCVSITHHEPCS